MVCRYGLRDDQGAKIEHLLPGRDDTVGVTAKDNRLFVEGGVIPVSRRDSMAGFAGAVRGFPGHPHAPYALEQNRCLEAGVRAAGR